MTVSSKLYQFQNNAFNIIIVASYLLYGCFDLGLSTTAPQYLSNLDYYVKIYISLFLLWRFNPFTTIEFTDLDRKIAFSAGIFLFTTSAINQILVTYLKQIKAYFDNK